MQISNKMIETGRWSFLKNYWWLIGLGLITGFTITIDPFFRSGYYPEEYKLGIWKKFWSYPCLLTSLILVVPPVLYAIYRLTRRVTRLHWDLLLLFALISTTFINFWGWVHIHLTFIIIMMTTLILILRGAMVGRFDFIRAPADKYLYFLTLVMIFSVNGPLGTVGVMMGSVFQFFLSMILPILFLHNVIRTRKQMMTCIRYMIYLSIFCSILGILQFLAYKFLGLDYTGNWTMVIGRYSDLPIIGRVSRVAGLTGNPNYLAFEVGTMTVMMAFMLTRPTFFSRAWRRIFLVSVILGCICIVFTVSRGAWLALMACFGIIPFVAFPKYKYHILLAYILIVAFGYMSGLFQYLYDMVYNIRASAIGYRERIEGIGVDAFVNYPWTGIGFGSFNYYWNFPDTEVHNLWLDLACQAGVFSALILLIYLLSLLFRLTKAAFHARGFNRVILQSFFFGIIFFLIQSMVRPQVWSKFYWFYFGFLEAAIYTLGRGREVNKIYYPIFGYSWKDEPGVQLESKGGVRF